jgi:hypothetical protein
MRKMTKQRTTAKHSRRAPAGRRASTTHSTRSRLAKQLVERDEMSDASRPDKRPRPKARARGRAAKNGRRAAHR